ncbi:MAG TPA: DUF4349 domain-containing protein [Cryptosporangiaceae bacterium]|nr:DUF4349 domain-containing protein [Cryptosporangiaceae bacterium]
MTLVSRSRKPSVLVTGAALVAAMLLAGCGQQSESAERGAPRPAQAGAPRDSGTAQDKATTPGMPRGVPLQPAGPREIVYTGELTVQVDDVTDAAGQAGRIATAAGGFVGGDERHTHRGNATATLVLRVPAAAFYTTVQKVSDLGRETSRQVGTADVTEQVIDLDSRIASQRASVARTRALLSRAQQISDIVTIERELSSREAELGALEAKKRTLADQVTLSTVTVRLIGPVAVTPSEEPERGFLAGLAAGWEAFVTATVAVLTGLGAALPFLLAVAVPTAVVWLLVRRGSRRRDRARIRPDAPSSVAPAPGPAPAPDPSDA